jgi:hypothetical protein
VELVEVDQRGNQGYIYEIDNSYKRIHIFEHWPETLATNNVQRPVLLFYLFPFDWRTDHHDKTQLLSFSKLMGYTTKIYDPGRDSFYTTLSHEF